MKKKILVTICILLCGVSVFAENVPPFKDLIVNDEKGFDEDFLDLPIMIQYVQDSDYKSDIFSISFTAHKLGEGKAGTPAYIQYTSEEVTMNFKTDEQKEVAYKALKEEYERRKEQKRRIEENRRLNPKEFDYQKLPVLDMATMGVHYAPNPSLIVGNVYLADRLRVFYVINQMGNNEYNIGEDPTFSSYGSYQFILRNSSSKGMSDYMFADTAYLRYFGTKEVIMSNGYVRYMPYFELLKINPHENAIRKIVDECEKW